MNIDQQMNDFLNADLDLCLRRASAWKFVKKTNTYEATVSDFEERLMRIGRGAKRVFVPVNTKHFSFTREQLDSRDTRIATTLDLLNSHYTGPKRRAMMAKSLRYSYFIWHRPHPFTKDGTDNYVSRVLFAGTNFKDPSDFYCVLEHIKLLHDPKKPLEVKPGVFADVNFVIAEPEKHTTKTLLSEIDLAERNQGLKERMGTALALNLDKYEMSRLVLRPESIEVTNTLPDDFIDDVEFSF